jgi:hypothetical protein
MSFISQVTYRGQLMFSAGRLNFDKSTMPASAPAQLQLTLVFHVLLKPYFYSVFAPRNPRRCANEFRLDSPSSYAQDALFALLKKTQNRQ